MTCKAVLLSASLLALPLLGGCAIMEGADHEYAELSMPAAFEYLQENAGAAPSPQWWSAFNTDALNGLEQQAMLANNNLLAGVERVLQARAGVGTARAGLLPQISANQNNTWNENTGGGGGVFDPNTGQFTPGTGAGGFSESNSARISASYELDLFGGNRASLRSSRAALSSSIYNQRALELSIQADVANFYFNVLSLRERLDTARQNLDSVERVMDLVQRQYDAGAVSGFDLSRQRSAVASARARIPSLEQQLAQAESGLALLVGTAPQGFDAPGGDIRAILPPPVDAGLPSDLLWRRPDLLAAEATLAGADADIDAARAAFFPSVDLSAGLSISDVFDTAVDSQSYGISLAQTLFGGGRLTAQFERNRARYRELALNYRQSVLTALKDVDDALVSLRASEQAEELQQIAADEAQRAFDLSEARYQAGADDLLAVLDAQRTLLDASDSLVQARQSRLNAAVGLFAALGGGWAPDEATARLAAR